MLHRLSALALLVLFHAGSYAAPASRTCVLNAWDKATEMYVDHTGCKSGTQCGTCNLQELSTSDGHDVQIGEYGVAVFACTIETDKSAPIHYYVGKLGNKRTATTPCPLRLFLDSVKQKQD